MSDRLKHKPHEADNNPPQRKQFESDTQKVVRRHLENEEDIITEEDIRNVRVGMTPPLDPPTEEALRERGEKAADRKKPDENTTLPGKEQITPWDVVEPED